MAFFRVGRRACGGGESMRDISKRSIVITILGLPVCAKNLLRYATEVRRWLENRQLGRVLISDGILSESSFTRYF